MLKNSLNSDTGFTFRLDENKKVAEIISETLLNTDKNLLVIGEIRKALDDYIEKYQKTSDQSFLKNMVSVWKADGVTRAKSIRSAIAEKTSLFEVLSILNEKMGTSDELLKMLRQKIVANFFAIEALDQIIGWTNLYAYSHFRICNELYIAVMRVATQQSFELGSIHDYSSSSCPLMA